jgi:hypothetical protein
VCREFSGQAQLKYVLSVFLDIIYEFRESNRVNAAEVWRCVDIFQVGLSVTMFLAPLLDQSACCILSIPTPHTSPTSAAETGLPALLGRSRLHHNYAVLYSLLSLSSSRWNMTWFIGEQAFYRNEARILKTIDWNVRRHAAGRSYKARGWHGISFLLHEFGEDYVRQILRVGGPWTSDAEKFWGIHSWHSNKRSQQKGCFFQELLIILRRVLISQRIFQCCCVFSQEKGPIQNMVFWNMTECRKKI